MFCSCLTPVRSIPVRYERGGRYGHFILPQYPIYSYDSLNDNKHPNFEATYMNNNYYIRELARFTIITFLQAVILLILSNLSNSVKPNSVKPNEVYGILFGLQLLICGYYYILLVLETNIHTVYYVSSNHIIFIYIKSDKSGSLSALKCELGEFNDNSQNCLLCYRRLNNNYIIDTHTNIIYYRPNTWFWFFFSMIFGSIKIASLSNYQLSKLFE
jgi:hypothetical protein